MGCLVSMTWLPQKKRVVFAIFKDAAELAQDVARIQNPRPTTLNQDFGFDHFRTDVIQQVVY